MFYKSRIGVDIDGVISDSNRVLISYINENHGTNIVVDDVKDYWYKSLSPVIDPAIVNDAWKYIHRDGLLIDSPLMPNAQLFNMLPGDISLVTHRDVSGKQTTLDWLYKNHFYRHANVHFVKGPKSQLGVWDYFMEDCPENVWDLSPFVRQKIILFNHPYNINDDMPDNVLRVNDWTEVIQFFQGEILKGVIN